MTDPQSLNALTKYVVLRLDYFGDGSKERTDEAWSVVGRVGARDGNAAIKAKASTTDPGTYIAVPERSWQPVKVTPKVETTLVLEEAK